MKDIALKHEGWVVVADGEKALFLFNEGDEVYPNLKVFREMEHENPPSRRAGDGQGRAPFGRRQQPPKRRREYRLAQDREGAVRTGNLRPPLQVRPSGPFPVAGTRGASARPRRPAQGTAPGGRPAHRRRGAEGPDETSRRPDRVARSTLIARNTALVLAAIRLQRSRGEDYLLVNLLFLEKIERKQRWIEANCFSNPHSADKN